jgi:hypothetical protein
MAVLKSCNDRANSVLKSALCTDRETAHKLSMSNFCYLKSNPWLFPEIYEQNIFFRKKGLISKIDSPS